MSTRTTRTIFDLPESPFHRRAQRHFPDLASRKSTRVLGADARSAVQPGAPRREPSARARTAARQAGTGGAAGVSGDLSESGDRVLLILEGEVDVCVCVWNGCHQRRVVVVPDSEGWGALDEELSDGEWELPSHVPPIRFGGSNAFKPALPCAICRLPPSQLDVPKRHWRPRVVEHATYHTPTCWSWGCPDSADRETSTSA
jgi:hypothetical protein